MDEYDEKVEGPQDRPDDEPVGPAGSELLIEYLQSKQGHKIADRLVTLFESKQKQAIEQGYKFQTRVLFAQLTVFIVTLGVLTFLSYRAKVDPTLALLIGTLVGYFFGKRVQQ
jgi:hypothetical protein